MCLINLIVNHCVTDVTTANPDVNHMDINNANMNDQRLNRIQVLKYYLTEVELDPMIRMKYKKELNQIENEK